MEIGKSEGAKLKCGGNRLDQGEYQHGYFMEPTVFVDVDPKMRIAQEEIFGPVVSIIPCEDLEDAIAIANGIEYGLSSALYTKDVNKAFTAMRDLHAGITYINAPTIGAEVHLPFGGVKATGNGHREGGMGAIDFYTEWKAVYVDYSDRLQKAQIDQGGLRIQSSVFGRRSLVIGRGQRALSKEFLCVLCGSLCDLCG